MSDFTVSKPLFGHLKYLKEWGSDMEVHVLFECFDQRSFYDYNRGADADPAREVVCIYGNIAKAQEEKRRLEAAVDPEDGSGVYYEIETHDVE